MFKRKNKKTGCETPTYSRFSIAPEPKSASKPNPNYVPPASVQKTGVQTPEFRKPTPPPPIPDIKYATSETFDNINNLVIKSIESISIIVEKDRQTASMEFTGLQDATYPTMEITSWDNEYVNYLGNVVFANRLTVRDAFAPGGTVRLKGTFEDTTTHELYDGEMDMLTWKFTKKENN